VAEVSVWVDELQEGALPPVCVKSGRAADARLTFRFVTGRAIPGALEAVTTLPVGRLGARRARGELPLTRRWRATFIALRAVVTTAGVASVTLLLLVQAVVPDAWRLTVLGLAAGAFGVFAALGLLYSALRPKGTLHADRSNQRWIVLHDVHPSFVAAVEAIEAARPHSGAAKSR